MRLDAEKECDIIDEPIEGYDMAALMGMRLKVFRYTKCKLMIDLERSSIVDIGPYFSCAQGKTMCCQAYTRPDGVHVRPVYIFPACCSEEAGLDIKASPVALG